MTKIFAIYPTDKQQSTKFLNKINTYLKRKIDTDWHCYKIKFTDDDHQRCLNKVACSSAKLILFMGHGRSDCLFGSCAKESNDFVSSDAIQHNEIIYKNENFINSGNIDFFKDKVLFSFSCNSNRNEKNSLGRKAIENNVRCFIGFGDIPTDYIKKNNLPIKAIAQYKNAIIKIINHSIYISITNNYSCQDLVDMIKIYTMKEIQSLILSKNKMRHRDQVIEHLFLFKKEIVIFGNRFEKII